MSDRTWFGTLTVGPAARMRLLSTARRHVRLARCEDYDGLRPAEQLKELANAASPDLSRFFKRLRKRGAEIRYLLVTEAHADGMPHWHLLLHEVGAEPVTKRELEAQWKQGFTHWRLVQNADPQAAFYVTKYLAKDALTRVRASAGYGRPRMRSDLAAEIANYSAPVALDTGTGTPVEALTPLEGEGERNPHNPSTSDENTPCF